jgi:MFS family permease
MRPPHADESVETPYGWAVLAASLAFVSIAFGASYLAVVSLKPIAADFGWPRWIPSLGYSSILLGSGLGGIVMGMWADRVGIHWPARLGAVMMGVGLVTVSRSDSAPMMLAAFGLLVGFMGISCAFAPMLTNVTRWFDRRRGMAVAIVASGQSVAGAVWPTIFNWGIEGWGWRATFLTFGVFATTAMLPLTLVLARRPPKAAVQTTPLPGGGAGGPIGRRWDGEEVASSVATARLVLLSVAIVGCCIAMAMPMVHVVAFCSDLGFEAARGAEMLSLLLACGVVSRLGFGWLSDRIGGLTTIFIGSGMQALTLGFYAVVDTLLGLYVLSAVFGLVFGGIVPAYALAVRELFPARDAGWRMGVVFLFGTVGMASGGFLGGWIFDLTGQYPMAFLVGVGANVVNLMAIATLLWRGRRMQPVAA